MNVYKNDDGLKKSNGFRPSRVSSLYRNVLVLFLVLALIVTSFPGMPVAQASMDADHDALQPALASDIALSQTDVALPIEVHVVNEAMEPMESALVYRLTDDQQVGGEPLVDENGIPLRTDEQGYVDATGLVGIGDHLLAIAPIGATESYTMYHTSGHPSAMGVEDIEVTTSGVQEIIVSQDNPLFLFNLDVSIEWDASNDPTYLQQLQFNLQRASDYLYDITNGQAALGDIIVSQNADDWVYSHIVVHASNDLRPYAAQGGIVITPTIDPDDSNIVYDIGQIAMGATWNRYGDPGYNLDDDWSLVLAHELGHYLFFQDEVYLGMNEDGLLIPVDSCIGSVMGDPYTDMRNTEFIADDAHWSANCADTLANQTLGRDEWQTVQRWYPEMIAPSDINDGPSLMPFNLTTIQVDAPITPTNALQDPTFYLDYADREIGSSEARAYIVRDDYVVDVGSPIGGQNRIVARGLRPGDELCVYDRAQHQYGCETVEMGDDRLSLEKDVSWTPVVQISPVTSTTLDIRVEGLTSGLPLYARLYPEYGAAEESLALQYNGDAYEGTYTLSDLSMSGAIRIWVDEASTELNPRHETMVAYAIAGNPGRKRGRGTDLRGDGGRKRGRGGAVLDDNGRKRGRGGAVLDDNGRKRGRGGRKRGRGAMMLSTDGQMIYFNANEVEFAEGQFYTIQDMAGLPPLPPGRTVIGQGYNMIATPSAPVMDGSISFEYMGSDVIAAGGDEDALTIYFWDGTSWTGLDTIRDTYYNLASAQSQGPGVYVLMSSVEIALESAGWNLVAYPVKETRSVEDALQSIDGHYTMVKGYDATDQYNPWRRHIVGLPSWLAPFVNNLHQMEFGKGYFIYATGEATWFLSHDSGSTLAATTPEMEAALAGMPRQAPATYFGMVQASDAFVPAADMPVIARVDDTVCGQGTTQAVDGKIVYVVDVAADESSETAGCGAPGRMVTFEVGGHTLATTAAWDNSDARELTLQNTRLLYLPMIQR